MTDRTRTAARVAAGALLAASTILAAACSSTPQVVITPTPTTPVPPLAVLTVPNRPPVEGAVGSYSWDGFASDSPWIPGDGPVLVAPDIVAHVRLPAGVEVSEWSARYAPLDGATVDDTTVTLQQIGASAEIDFPAPPAGSWSVQLEVRYVGHGSATYYWRFDVAPGS